MTPGQLQQLYQDFDGYIEGFKEPDGALPALLKLKLVHSRMVAEEARLLAQALDWSEEDVGMAEAVGLVHDAGRFPQFRDHATFDDSQSIDHGGKGRQVIEQEGWLDHVPGDERRRILRAVELHNRRILPDDLADDERSLTGLLRDADKLDIYRVADEIIRGDRAGEFADMLPDLDLAGGLNPELLEQFHRGGICTFDHVRSLADMHLMRLSWVFDLNTRPAVQTVIDRGLVEALQSHLPAGHESTQAMEKARRHLAYTLKGDSP